MIGVKEAFDPICASPYKIVICSGDFLLKGEL
jgi:hypothetical protein